MDRGRDRRYNDDRALGSETYRPSERQDPPRSNYRSYRSPPRRGRTPPSYASDTYAPSADRRRSRSPPYSGRGGGSYRGRPRSPPSRAYSPRRDARPRSPPPRARKYSRSPVRPRSPIPMKRDPSPYDDWRARSPIPMKRDRPASPSRGRYDRRDYSPPRTTRPRFPNENNYRPGERSRSPPPRRPEHISRVPSPISSRRSSPPIHPDRLANTESRPHSPAHRNPRGPHLARDSSYRERSPLPRRGYSPIPISPSPEAYRQASPPSRDRNDYASAATPQAQSYHNGEPRAPPTGPAAAFPRDTPSAPRHSAPVSISAHNRPGSASIPSGPTRGRGGASYGRGEPREYSYGGPMPHRGGRPPPASPYHGPPPHFDSRPTQSDSIPHGPRSAYGGPPPFRANNSSSTTYPRTQRFAANHLASLPAVVPGGKALPSADPAAEKKIRQLEEDAKKMRDQIEEKQREKRAGLREWETRERESRREGLRSELAESQLEGLSGEVIGGTAF